MPLAKVTHQRQKEAELRRALREMRTAIDKFKDAADAGMISAFDLKPGSENYPPDLETLVEGVAVVNDATGRKLKFLRRIPIDPITSSTEWGLRSYQDRPDSTSWGGQNVYDVYTKADGTALDGTQVQGLVTIMARPSPCRCSALAIRRRGVSGGFTLIELLIVHGADLDPGGDGGRAVSQRRAPTPRRACCKTDLFRMRDAIDQYYADKNKYPASLDTLVSDGYMRRDPRRPDHAVRRHLADGARRGRSQQPDRRAGHLRRQERRARALRSTDRTSRTGRAAARVLFSGDADRPGRRVHGRRFSVGRSGFTGCGSD